LLVARKKHPGVQLVVADAFRLPIRSRSIDLVTTAQALHHIQRPVDVLKELRRVVAPGGRVLVVDSVATESIEEALAMNELDLIRDPSHAAFRSPSTMRMLVQSAGLTIVDEHLSVEEQRLSEWMWPGEFADNSIDKVRRFIEERGHETGMRFERAGDDWVFERRRLMLLCQRP
jgi:SAM-dependent methyltransferase